MKNQIIIPAGVPDDYNRDYMPESIKGSRIVVNENGNNSQPYPDRLTEYKESLVGDGQIDVWYEYVPASYDPAKKTPLVFSMHGGLMTGWGQAIYSSWTLVAEREGFICVFPDGSGKCAWMVEMTDAGKEGIKHLAEVHPEFDFGEPLPPDRVIDDNRDFKLVFALIERMKREYNIDEGRIFMQGMSMGNAITSQFARNFGHLLAGEAGSGGPVSIELLYRPDGSLINRSGSIAVWQTRPERNGTPHDVEMSEYDINRFNRAYWLELNECADTPEISVVGEDNLMFFHGKKADLVYLDVKNRDHGQTFDEAELTWDYLFSGTKRMEDGTILHFEPNRPRKGDRFAFAFATDAVKVWFRNRTQSLKTAAVNWNTLKYHGLYGDSIIRGTYLCAPLSFLAEAFEADYKPDAEGTTAFMRLKDGRIIQFARGCIGCVVENRVVSMLCETLYRDGELLVSVEWFCRYLFNMNVSACGDVMYVTDHYALLSHDTAQFLSDILHEREA